jgi:tripartite-type tricarboxylate transporter receptor subunit TctC
MSSARRLPVLVCGLALTCVAVAQSYPNRPVRLLVPSSPGGATDVVARILAPALTDALGKPFVVDNRAGANGIIGTDTAARAAPDGYTLIVVFDSFVTTPYVFKSVPYDYRKDFADPAARSQPGFVVHPKVGVRTFGDFHALARSRPTPDVFATAGATLEPVFGELLKSMAGSRRVCLLQGGDRYQQLSAGTSRR